MTIQDNSTAEIIKVEIFDIYNQLLLKNVPSQTKYLINLDLTQLSSGVYFVKTYHPNSNNIQKLIITQ